MSPSLRSLCCLILLALAAAVYPTQASSTETTAPSPDAVLGVFPFQDGEPNRVLVDLAAEGARPFVMMLDTGAAGSVMTPLMARRLGVSVRPHKSSPYRRATRLGRDLQFWVDTSSSDTGAKTGWEYGLLGCDFLDDYVVEIDFPGRIVRFIDPEKYEVPREVSAPDERTLPFKLAGTRIIVPVEVGGKEVAVGLDTGAPNTLILSGPVARKLGIRVDELTEFGRGGTVLGPMEQRFYEAAEFRFAGFSYAPLPVIVAPHGLYNMGLGNDSLLGYDVLRPFVMRIDYANSRIWLKLTGDPRVTFLGADYATSKKLGALLIPDGKRFYVYYVVPGGPAARYGLREGDAIVPAAGDELPTVAEVVAKIEVRADLTVARRDGDVWIDHSLPEDLPEDPTGETSAE